MLERQVDVSTGVTHKKRMSVYSSIGSRATRRPSALTRSLRLRRSSGRATGHFTHEEL